jgi:glycosyltransferase involved in cell wall biosynthesis
VADTAVRSDRYRRGTARAAARAPRVRALFYNNPETYPPIVNSSRLLAGAGFEVEILCRDIGPRWQVAYPREVRVDRMNTRAGSSWREYAGYVARVLRAGAGGAALFVGHDMHGLLPARLLAARYRRPLVYHCHELGDPRQRLMLGGRLVRRFEQRFARTADLVIVPDAERGEILTRDLRLAKPPIVVANAPLERPEEVGTALQRALAGQGLSLQRIVYRQGRVGVGHAIEATIRSMQYWRDPSWGFVLIGPGEPAYLDRLRDLAEVSGVAGRFAVLPPVSYDEVARFTPGAHLGHALYEPIDRNNIHSATSSNKLMEYMAAGLPLLVSDTPAASALVGRCGCGVTAIPDEPQSIAAAVNAVLGDPERARRMGAAAARCFDAEFCYPRQFAAALDAIRDLAAR